MYDQTVLRTRSPVERALFDYALNLNGFLWDKLFDPKMIPRNIAKIPQADKSKLRIPNFAAKTNAKAPRIEEQFFYRNIDLEEKKGSSPIDPHEVANSDNPSLLDETRKSQLVTLGIILEREQLAATLATTSGNYNASLTSALAAGDRWDDNGDAEAQAMTAHNNLVLSCGQKANAVAMSGTTWRKLRINANFRDRVKFSGPVVTMEAVKAFFDVDYFFVTDNSKNGAAEGIADSMSSMWGTNAIFFVYQPSISLDMQGFGCCYMRTTPYWQKTIVDETLQGPDGPMREVQVGSEYQLAKGYVDGEATGLFAGGYLYRTVVS